MILYARLPDVLADLNAQGVTGSNDRIVDAIAEATRAAITMTGGRQFHSTTETRYFDGNAKASLYVGDLISVTTLKFDEDGDGVYEETLTTSDYWLWPDNTPSGYAYRRIDLNPEGDYSTFPSGRRRVQIVGKWGHSELTEPVLTAAGVAITATVATTSGLSITASASVASIVEVGDTLIAGTEQFGDVTSVTTSTIVVRARGINGTTAAAHSGVALYLRRYPSDIERAVRMDAARHLWGSSQGYPEGSFREKWPAIAQTLNSYSAPEAIF